MRKRSGANFDQLLNKEWNILTKNEQLELQNQYKRTQQRAGGGISFYDMIAILRSTIYNFNDQRRDQINKDIAQKQTRVLDMNVLLNYAAQLKKQRQDNNKGDIAEENEYLDAFVALGGHVDKSGAVSKSALIQTIKREFELTFDIEAMIEGVTGDSLDYSAFCSIFEHDKEKGDGRLASAASQRSLRSNDSMKSLVIEERDFQKFIAQYENEEMYSL